MATKKARKAAPEKHPSDVTVTREGLSIMLFWPHNDDVRSWLRKHTGDDAIWIGAGAALCVDPRYALDLAEGIKAAAYTVA